MDSVNKNQLHPFPTTAHPNHTFRWSIYGWLRSGKPTAQIDFAKWFLEISNMFNWTALELLNSVNQAGSNWNKLSNALTNRFCSETRISNWIELMRHVIARQTTKDKKCVKCNTKVSCSEWAQTEEQQPKKYQENLSSALDGCQIVEDL